MMRNVRLPALVVLLLCVPALAAAVDSALPSKPSRKAAAQCQDAMSQAGTKLVTAKLKSLDACSTALLTCIQTKPGDGKCTNKAEKTCLKALSDTIPQTEIKLAAKIVKSCGAPLRPADLLASDGLDMASRAPACDAAFGLDICDLGDLARCVVKENGRVAERLFATQQPRARELISTLPQTTPPTYLPPFEDCGGCSLNPGSAGAAIAQCGAALTKSGRAFAAAVQGGIGKCLAKVFACIQTKGSDPVCLAKAAVGCDAVVAKLDVARTKLSGSIDKRCAEAIVPFANLAAKGALNLDVVADDCTALGGNGLSTIGDYAACLQRQHTCGIARVFRNALPRASAAAEEGLLGSATTLVHDVTCPDSLPSELLVTAAGPKAARASTSFVTNNFFGVVRKIPTGILTPIKVGSPAPPSAQNAPRRLNVFGVQPRFVPGKPQIVKIRYLGSPSNLRSGRGTAAVPTTLFVGARSQGQPFDDHLEFPLDAVPPNDEGVVELEFQYVGNPPSCLVTIDFAVGEDGEVSAYESLDQIEDTELPPTPVPTATPPPPTAARTATPVATGSPTLTGSPTVTTTPSATATVAATPTVVPLDLTCGTVLSRSITTGGQVHALAFSGSAGDVITLTLLDGFSGSTFPIATVSSPSGSQLGSQITPNAAVNFTLQQTGIHIVTVKGNTANATGAYTLGLDCLVPPGPADANLTCGAVESGTLSPAGDADFLTFTGQAGDIVSLTLVAVSGSTPQITVFSPTGATVGSQFSGNTVRTFALLESGTHRIRVNTTPIGGTSTYNVGYECLKPLGPTDDNLTCGGTHVGVFSPAGDTDFVTFTGQAGDVVTLTLVEGSAGGTFATATVLAPSGATVGSQLNATGSANYTLQESGLHVVRIAGNVTTSTDSYRLSLDCLVPPGPADANLTCGAVESGTLSFSGDADFLTFTGQAGDVVSLTLVDVSGSTPQITVFSPTGATVGSQFSGDTVRTVTLLESGTHRVRVNTTPLGGTSTYNVGYECLKPLGPTDGALVCGGTHVGAFSPAGDTDFVTFTGQAGDVVTLTLVEGSAGGTFATATVLAPSGATVGSQLNATGSANYTLQESGLHVVRIAGNVTTSTDSYRLSLDCLVPPGPADANLTCGAVESGTLSFSGDADFLTFTGQAGDVVSLTLVDVSGSTPQITVFSPTGATVGSQFSGDTVRNFTLLESGEHRIRVNTTPLGGTASYNVGFECLVPLGPVDAALACGATHAGTIGPAADTDFVTFEGTAGTSVTITLTDGISGSLAFPVATVFTPSGAQVGSQLNGTASSQYSLTETGTHAIRVTGNSPSITGNFSVKLECSP